MAQIARNMVLAAALVGLTWPALAQNLATYTSATKVGNSGISASGVQSCLKGSAVAGLCPTPLLGTNWGTPASSKATCAGPSGGMTQGEVDAHYFYVCVAPNTWSRTPLGASSGW